MKNGLLLAVFGLMLLAAPYSALAAEQGVTVYAARFGDAEKPALLESRGAFKTQPVDFAVLADNKDAAARIAGENG